MMSIFVMFLLFILIVKIVHERVLIVDSCQDGTIENVLQNERADFYEIYDYKYISMKSKTIVFIKKNFDENLPSFSGDLNSRFMSCYDYVSKFTYVKNQSNPNKAKTEGGNCQALSLYLKYLLNKNNIDSKLEGTKDHVYLIVSLGNSNFKVDISNKIVEEVD